MFHGIYHPKNVEMCSHCYVGFLEENVLTTSGIAHGTKEWGIESLKIHNSKTKTHDIIPYDFHPGLMKHNTVRHEPV